MHTQDRPRLAILLALGLGAIVTGGAACGDEPPSVGGAGAGGLPGSGGTSSAGRAGAGGADRCPAGLPGSSTACSPDGLSCYYAGCSGAASYCGATASCTNGTWSVGFTNCICPSNGGASSVGGSGAGGGAGGCSRRPNGDAQCVAMGYPPHAYFCSTGRPDPTCVLYTVMNSGDAYCCP